MNWEKANANSFFIRRSPVGNFVTVKASKNRKVQRPSIGGLQQVQYQSLRINEFQ